MEIRERRDDDIAQLVAVATRVNHEDRYPIFLPDGDFYRFLTRPKPLAAWVAVSTTSLVGHVALNAETSRPVMQLVADLMTDRRAAYISRLLVDPGDRRRGVGRALLERARTAAVDRGHVAFLDVVDTPATAAAISLYHAEGWEEVGRVSFDLVDQDVTELVFRAPSA